MFQLLKQDIIKRVGADLDNIELVLNEFKSIKVARNEFLLKQGEVCKQVYFIAKGCLQIFVYDQDMNETTRDIA